MSSSYSGFDWDDGNRAKCLKHGVSVSDVEGLFDKPIFVFPDDAHSQSEARMRAIGKTGDGRAVFLVFTVRNRNGKQFIRPVSARFMHKKEIRYYEKENPNL